ncbi:MAG TPA: hypothetical protein VJ799_07450 [Nitrososphaeraceae archaeon]|nr:hypothetical protein [Nitrososphaeraceae archaeon]
MIREPYLVLLVIGFIFSMVFSTNTNNFINQEVYAHMFTADETASFLAFADQLQVESELVQNNLVNNNLSLAQNHANKAASLLTPSVVIEIEEQNQKIADDLTTAVSDLQKISSYSEKQQQMVKQLVSDINSTVVEAVNIRMKQGQGDPSNFLEKGIEFLGGIFGGGGEEADDKIDVDETTKPIAFADLVDSVLINYGNAYRVDFDMTNMSNMAMMGGNSSSMAMVDMADKNNSNNSSSGMNIGSMNMTMMNMNSKTNRNYSLVDMTDYQSAQALATKAQEIFNNELKSTAPNNSSAFITNLENGLRQLNDSIKNKVSPVDIMTIVHTQIHPNLLEIFNLSTAS